MAVHSISKGETLGKVARSYGVTVQAILNLNPSIKNPDLVQIGHKLQIPSTEGKSSPAGVASASSTQSSSVGAKNTKSDITEEKTQEELLYTVKPGDSMGRIAAAHGLTVEEVLKANPSIKNPDRIFVGQKLLIPKKTGRKSADPIQAAPAAAVAAKSANAATASSTTAKGAGNRKSPKALTFSDRGVRFIAYFEGFEEHLYNDAANHCTIGYGHLVHYGPCTDLDKKRYPNGISRSAALDLLKKDAQIAVKGVQRQVKVDLAQHEFDALVSWVFNLGEGNLKASTMLKKLNAGDYASVPKEMNRWTKAGGKQLKGLVRRRASEGKLFNQGTYQ